VRVLWRDEYPSEWAALDEVPKCLCSTFQRKGLSDDWFDLARPEKPCDRRPCFCQNRDGLSEQREAFDARTLPDQVRHIDGRFSARCIAERGETSARRQNPERFAEDTSTHAALKETGRKNFWANLQEIDGLLAGKEWVQGAQFTTCDPYTLVFYGWGTRIELPMNELKNYTAWKDRMLKRPAVMKVLQKEESILLKAA